MNCEQMNELLSAWLDGELSPTEEQQMQAHLEQCAQCRALFEQLQALHTSCSDMEELSAPDGFAQRVMERVADEPKAKVVPLFRRPPVRSLAALAACAVLVVGFGRGVLNGGMLGRSAKSASNAADYAAAPESAVVEYSMEEPAQAAPETTEMERPASMADLGAACAPQIAQGGAQTTGARMLDDAERGGAGEIILYQLPDGLEEKVGRLVWEERIEDGAQCARLSLEQAELLMELVREQGIDVEEVSSEAGTETDWTLVWLRD